MVPDESSANLDELKFLAVQLSKNPRLPVLRDLRQLFGKIHFVHRTFSCITSVHYQPDAFVG